MQTIPLKGGSANAHQRISVSLGDVLVQLRLNYLQSGQWSVDMYRDDELIAAGLMLEPGCDIIALNKLGLGHLVFTGELTTLDNLGVDNQLVYVAANE